MTIISRFQTSDVQITSSQVASRLFDQGKFGEVFLKRQLPQTKQKLLHALCVTIWLSLCRVTFVSFEMRCFVLPERCSMAVIKSLVSSQLALLSHWMIFLPRFESWWILLGCLSHAASRKKSSKCAQWHALLDIRDIIELDCGNPALLRFIIS